MVISGYETKVNERKWIPEILYIWILKNIDIGITHNIVLIKCVHVKTDQTFTFYFLYISHQGECLLEHAFVWNKI